MKTTSEMAFERFLAENRLRFDKNEAARRIRTVPGTPAFSFIATIGNSLRTDCL